MISGGRIIMRSRSGRGEACDPTVRLARKGRSAGRGGRALAGANPTASSGSAAGGAGTSGENKKMKTRKKERKRKENVRQREARAKERWKSERRARLKTAGRF